MDKNLSSEYNQRQLKLMCGSLQQFFGENISLGELVGQLKRLFWALESPEEDWAEDFLSEWGFLEVKNAIVKSKYEISTELKEASMVDRNIFQIEITEAAKKIDQLILTKITGDGGI